MPLSRLQSAMFALAALCLVLGAGPATAASKTVKIGLIVPDYVTIDSIADLAAHKKAFTARSSASIPGPAS
ncbi:MAG: hypothetical protein AB7U59_05330 [Desulfovibrionaceae bacterium]|jgi:ABC-type sugar transport system substrate-binding protein